MRRGKENTMRKTKKEYVTRITSDDIGATGLEPEQLEPKSIGLHIGQCFKMRRAGIVKNVMIKKFYRHHALCLVNGKYYESVAYFDFLTNILGRKDAFSEAE